MREDWSYKMFEDCLVKAPKAKQVQTSEYNAGSKYPIISQEDKMVSGYCDDSSLLYHIDKPVVIFGDHTRVLKYVDFDFVVGADGVKILIPKDFLKAKFLLYYLRWYKVPSLGYSRHYKLLKEINLPIPTLPEQEGIVSELDLLSGIIEKKKEQLKEYDQLAQSIFYDMFGDPVTNEKGWEVKKLEDVCFHITDGDHMPPPKSDKGIPFLTIANIDKEKRNLDFNNSFFVPQEYYDNLKEERKARINDMLYTVTGSYGIPVIVRTTRPFCFQRHIAIIRPNQERVLTRFLFNWVLCPSVKEEADRVATGIAQKTVGLNSLRQFIVPLPPLSLQQSFAEKIEAIEQQKALIQQSIAEAETLFNSRMDYWFS